jgi:hypothetical protein
MLRCTTLIALLAACAAFVHTAHNGNMRLRVPKIVLAVTPEQERASEMQANEARATDGRTEKDSAAARALQPGFSLQKLEQTMAEWRRVAGLQGLSLQQIAELALLERVLVYTYSRKMKVYTIAVHSLRRGWSEAFVWTQ